MAEIRMEGLTKTFGSVVAVDGIDLCIGDGELLALLGPSGCGKTTALLMLAGIYRPTRGRIYFDDVMINDVPPKGRGVGLVFQSYALYPHMTVYDNIAFPLRLRRTPVKEIDRRVREVVKLAQIDELLQRRPSQLSGGQQQRVALCRALVREPDLLLLDEPLSNLDARLRIETRAEIKRLQRELGITTILVTHDQIEAMTMAERVAVMRKGRIEQLSTPADLYARPETLFVASFIGDPPMNLVHTKIVSENGRHRLVASGGFSADVPEALVPALHGVSGEDIVVGIRPEHVELVPEGTPGAVSGEVFMTELLGRDTLVDVRCGQEPMRILVPGDESVEPGTSVGLHWRPDAMHLFDGKTQQRVADGAVSAAGMDGARDAAKGA